MIFLVVTIICLSLIFTTPIHSSLATRIIGGEIARPGQFPYTVFIHVETPDKSVFCSGALISQRWIVTSGYCVHNATEFTVTLGSNTLTQDDSNRVIVSTYTYVLHPEFNSTTLENDIALIKLRQRVEFSEYVDEINLPITSYTGGVSVTAVGWGQTSDDEPGPVEYLNFVELVTLTNEECKLFYGSQIFDNMVCVSGSNEEGTCTGDSGSPLIYFLNNRHPIVIGVASFHSSYGCKSVDPSGYTRIFPYTNWIIDVTENLNDY